MARATITYRICRQTALWACGLFALSAGIVLAAPFGAIAASTTVYYVFVPAAASNSVFSAANARLIDQTPAFFNAHGYLISADKAIGPAALYRAGAWLVFSGKPRGCGAAQSSTPSPPPEV